jgi:small subunit ribosomal protein S4
MIGLLERRLDAIVYRAKFVPTVFAARQLISHGHVTVNGRKVDGRALKPSGLLVDAVKLTLANVAIIALELLLSSQLLAVIR